MLKIESIQKHFPGFQFGPLSLELARGEYFVLLGPSGNGKSVLLELIAGMHRPESGNIWLDGEQITNKAIHKRKCGLLFQDYALFPNMTVYQNMAYPLKNLKRTKAEIDRRIRQLAGEFELTGLLHRNLNGLSGGEKQRIALARVLALEPRILLLDEPASSIDAGLKVKLHQLLRTINQRGMTILHVTHDYEEALALGTRIGVMHQGKIIQTGTADAVFRRPVNQFVAQMVGIKNFYKAELVSGDKGQASQARINDKVSFRVLSKSNHRHGFVFIESKNIILSNQSYESSALNQFNGTVKQIIRQPNACEVELDIGVPVFVNISFESLQKLGVKEGKRLFMSFKASSCVFQPL